MLAVSFNRADQIRYQIKPSFQRNINAAPGLFNPVLEFDKPIVCANEPTDANTIKIEIKMMGTIATLFLKASFANG